MKHIDGRIFLWGPIILYIIYYIVSLITNHLDGLVGEERDIFIQDVVVVSCLILIAWSVFSVCMHVFYDNQMYIIYSPSVIFILLWIFIEKLNKFFKKHFTIKL
jgi:hypothetical protein